MTSTIPTQVRRWRASAFLVATLFLSLSSIPHRADAVVAPWPKTRALHVSGRYFLDDQGRVIILRGVNLAGDSKVPPFIAIDDPRVLDRLPQLGFNAVRLVFTWEAFEHSPGLYDWIYLARLRSIAAEAGARGLHVIVDIHQDGFSRNLSHGSGDGFPLWAVPPGVKTYTPENSPRCPDWPVQMILDPGMHRSFRDFYADGRGVRTRYLMMLGIVARTFAADHWVIGYDVLNEPWGDEKTELAPLYRDAAAVIRGEHPSAILFLEGHITTNMGLQTHLAPPRIENVVYAPHYYKPTTILTKAWLGTTHTIDLAFRRMSGTASEWNVPLFLGEFGVPAGTLRAGPYVSYIYDRLDDSFSSGAQWNFTPHWNEILKDGWNGEDYNIIDPSGSLRPNFQPRAFPRAIAGEPIAFRFVGADRPSARPASLAIAFLARPERGETEVIVPSSLFPIGSSLSVEPRSATVTWDQNRGLLLIRAVEPTLVRVTLTAPFN